jgi:hypothetical protein
VRRFHAREAWGEQSLGGRIALLAALSAWPLFTVWNTARYTKRNGFAVRERNGRGLARQAIDQLAIGLLYGITPREYYTFELFLDEKRRQAADYLSRHETSGAVVRALERKEDRISSRPALDMTNKEEFAAACRTAGLPVVPIFLVAGRSGVRAPAGVGGGACDRLRLPPLPLFFKPVHSSIRSIESTRPQSASRWDYVGEDAYEGQGGERLNGEELLARAVAIGAAGDYLVQPCLRNHPEIADLSNGALSSVTIQTFLDESNRPEVVAGMLHLAVGSNALADNVSLGGLVAAVDVATGIAGPATDSGKTPAFGWRDAHPDTGGRIKGRRLPLWQEALDLARRAHAVFSDRLVVGWDMALTADGPLLIEADPRGFVTMKQRAYGRPFGRTRYGELFAYHVERVTAGRPRSG